MTMYNVRTTSKTNEGFLVREASVLANHVGAAIQFGSSLAKGSAFSVTAEPITFTTLKVGKPYTVAVVLN